jgi:hypothetical protein
MNTNRRALSATLLALFLAPPALASPPVPPAEPALQWLVYHDGTRLPGHLLRREGEDLVFLSPRFGELRVSSREATLAPSALPAPPAGPSAIPPAPPAPNPAPVVTATPPPPAPDAWRGRVSASLETIVEADKRNNLIFALRLNRKWRKHEVIFNTSYELREENERTATDLVRSDLLLRHDWENRWYLQYRLQADYNRSFRVANFDLPYLFTRQDAVIGYRLIDGPRGMLRLGTGPVHYFFTLVDAEVSAGQEQLYAMGEFVEASLTLPWRTRLFGRFTNLHDYSEFSISSFETELELTRRLTDEFSLTFRYEDRRSIPGVNIQDRSLLRLFLGYDF